MKGVVFIALSEMIQEMYGPRVWNDFLRDSKVESGGIYTSTEVYDDKEAFQLLATVSEKLNKNQNDILYVFGKFLLKYYHKKYPESFSPKNFFDFMKSIDGKIHLEIEKVSPRFMPPIIKVKETSDHGFMVLYNSKRKLCPLAHGLMAGAAKLYGENVDIAHVVCMKDGNECCEFEVTYK